MFRNIKNVLDGKKVLILGFGKEGRSTLSFICDFVSPSSVTVADMNDVSASLPDGIKCLCGENYMSSLDDYDVIIKTPGIVYSDQSSDIIAKTTSQTDLFLREFSAQTVGITGTKGKSTTTSLIYHVMKLSGIDAVLAGNIGIPPLDAAREMKDGSVAVFEMSCHQLEFQRISPHVAVILNLFEDHLDHYGTRERYVKAKEHIFLHQSDCDVLVISEECREQIAIAPSKVIPVSYKPDFDIPKGEISLFGEHNFYNISVAKRVTDIYGVSYDDFINALKTFKPLPHRLEYVATINGVAYYDDSISTVCQTTIQAILSLEKVDTVIIGGMDRGIDYTELVAFFSEHTVKNIILAYESGNRIAAMLEEKGIQYKLTDDLYSAVRLASELTQSGGKCVLSPAAASYGYFKNFEERGNVFKELVNNL